VPRDDTNDTDCAGRRHVIRERVLWRGSSRKSVAPYDPFKPGALATRTGFLDITGCQRYAGGCGGNAAWRCSYIPFSLRSTTTAHRHLVCGHLRDAAPDGDPATGLCTSNGVAFVDAVAPEGTPGAPPAPFYLERCIPPAGAAGIERIMGGLSHPRLEEIP
jgi:hypothetical protein